MPLFASYPPPTPEQQQDSKAKVNWPAERITFTFNPDRAEVGPSGFTVSASASVSRDSEPESSETHKKRLAEIEMKRNELRNALKEASPESQCKDPEEVALIADDFELGPNNDGLRFLQKVFAMAVSAGEATAKRAEQWFKDARANPTTPPPDLGQAAVEQVANQLGVPAAANPTSALSPPTVSDGCIEKRTPLGTVKICP